MKNFNQISAASSLCTLPGISTVRERCFAACRIGNLGELITHFPRGYQNRGNVTKLALAEPDTLVSLILTVGTEPKSARLKNRMSITKFRAFDDSGSCEIIFFNRLYTDKSYPIGSTHRFYGRIKKDAKGLKLTSPESEPCFEGAKLLPLVPVYPLASGLTQKLVSTSIRRALDLLYGENAIPPLDPIPEDISENFRLCDRKTALYNIHFPESIEALESARKRLAFEELFLLSVSLSYKKEKSRGASAPAMKDTSLSELFEKLPFRLTGAQSRVCAEIAEDMKKSTPMCRLVTGDVGSGKTLCAAAAAYIAVKNGFQAALMVPTEILARQHYEDLKPLFESFDYKCELLIGALSPAEKKRVCAALASGETDLIIGTHALLTDKVNFARPGLVITDEQHRFGVRQRAVLGQKAGGVHTLVMSATPIPRTLALILYGDLDISQVDEMPPDRQRVDTFVVTESYRARLNGFIKKQVNEGHRVYIVCPSIDEEEKCDKNSEDEFDLNLSEREPEEVRAPLKSAVEYARKLREEVFPELSVGLIHGKMKAAEKEAAMADFASGKTQILVSTTVIEVGVNVPEATLMIVENAERFGLSQLHQLRGRVGRGSYKSYCVFVSNASANSPAFKRLSVMRESSDGYKIAEKDLENRGPGDFVSSTPELRQHGRLKLRLASGCGTELFINAADAAGRVIKEDPKLMLGKNAALKNYIYKSGQSTELFN